MRNWHQLPFEILNNIYNRISKKDCKQCSSTCKAWNVAARPIIFKTLRNLTDQKLQNFEALSIHNSKLQPFRDFVKIVSVSRLSPDFDMTLLDSVFPNIEEIRFDHSQEVVQKNICKLLLEGGFPNLARVPVHNFDEEYWAFVLGQRKNFKFLLFNEELDYEDLIEDTIEKPNHFNKLKTYELFTDSNQNLESVVPDNLTCLKSFNLVFRSSSSKLICNTALFDIRRKHHLKDVRIKKAHFFADADITYMSILMKFRGLNNLRMDCAAPNGPSHQRIHLSAELLSQFLLYLVEDVKLTSYVTGIISNQYTPDALEGFLGRVSDLRSIKKKKVECHLTIHVGHAGRLLLQQTTPFHHTTCDLFAFNDYNRNTKVCRLTLEYKLGREDIVTLQPCLKLFKKIGRMDLKSLSIAAKDEESNELGAIEFPLEKMLEYLTKLEFLELDSALHIKLSETPSNFVSNVQILKFNFCVVQQRMFGELDRICPSLRLLEIERCRFVRDSYYPQTDLLEQPEIIKIDMPSTSLDELQFFPYLHSEDSLPRCKNIFIKLETATTKPRYCKVKWKQLEIGGLHYSLIIDDKKFHYDEGDYSASIRDGACIVYTIHCKAVKKFVLKTTESNGCVVNNIIR